MKKQILFITGTRADFGKVKSLIHRVNGSSKLDYALFVTGMHTLSRYGYTVDEVYSTMKNHRLDHGFRSLYTFMNQSPGEPMDRVLANTILGLSNYVEQMNPDLIVVHGDRVEPLAGAIVGSLRNILVAHIEGGEVSGTADEMIRHAITKMAHIHFAANSEAAVRLKQMGEDASAIYVIGSPDIDLMLSETLPPFEEVIGHYQIPFEEYAVALLHPVTTNLSETRESVETLVRAMKQSELNYVVIYPNNDQGADLIFTAYEMLTDDPRFACYPSLRVEYFLTLLRNAQFIIGNSSAGIREAPVYGIPSIDIGSRQHRRFSHPSIVHVGGRDASEILAAIHATETAPSYQPTYNFGDGKSAERFLSVLEGEAIWKTSHQKGFRDREIAVLDEDCFGEVPDPEGTQ